MSSSEKNEGRLGLCLHRFLCKIPVVSQFLIFLAYLKNDVFRPSFEDRLIAKMLPGWREMTIIDLGCGPCQKERDRRFKGVDITCVDIYKPYLRICKEYGFKVMHADIRNIKDYFSENSVDIIWILDVVEHLDKKDGMQLLKQAERMAKKQVIVWTPAGWLPQDMTEDGNVFQKHRSAWRKEEFEKRGYVCEILENYHYDIRIYSKLLSKVERSIAIDALWAVFKK